MTSKVPEKLDPEKMGRIFPIDVFEKINEIIDYLAVQEKEGSERE